MAKLVVAALSAATSEQDLDAIHVALDKVSPAPTFEASGPLTNGVLLGLYRSALSRSTGNCGVQLRLFRLLSSLGYIQGIQDELLSSRVAYYTAKRPYEKLIKQNVSKYNSLRKADYLAKVCELFQPDTAAGAQPESTQQPTLVDETVALTLSTLLRLALGLC